MKTYTATLELSILIVGDKTDKRFTRKVMQSLTDEIEEMSYHDVYTEEARGFPMGWDKSTLVYGTDDNMTAEDALKLNEKEEPKDKDHPDQLYLFEK